MNETIQVAGKEVSRSSYVTSVLKFARTRHIKIDRPGVLWMIDHVLNKQGLSRSQIANDELHSVYEKIKSDVSPHQERTADQRTREVVTEVVTEKREEVSIIPASEIAGSAVERLWTGFKDDFEFSEGALVLKEGHAPSVEHCLGLFGGIMNLNEATAVIGDTAGWLLGDFALQTEPLHGEAYYSQVMDTTGKAYNTVITSISVCREFPKGVRRPELSFSHHKEVLYVKGLTSEARLALLDLAIDKGMGSDRLRRAARYAAKQKYPKAAVGKMVAMDEKELGSISSKREPKSKLRYIIIGIKDGELTISGREAGGLSPEDYEEAKAVVKVSGSASLVDEYDGVVEKTKGIVMR